MVGKCEIQILVSSQMVPTSLYHIGWHGGVCTEHGPMVAVELWCDSGDRMMRVGSATHAPGDLRQLAAVLASAAEWLEAQQQ